MSEETQIPMLNHYPPDVIYIAEKLGLSIPNGTRKFSKEKPMKVLVDDIDFMLKRFLGTEVMAAVLTES